MQLSIPNRGSTPFPATITMSRIGSAGSSIDFSFSVMFCPDTGDLLPVLPFGEKWCATVELVNVNGVLCDSVIVKAGTMTLIDAARGTNRRCGTELGVTALLMDFNPGGTKLTLEIDNKNSQGKLVIVSVTANILFPAENLHFHVDPQIVLPPTAGGMP
jgi:hypothetical protein